MRAPCIAVLLASSALAQTNVVPGLEGRLTNNASPTYFGRRGTHPNGEIGMSYSYTMCNPGTVAMPWSAPMNPLHPKFAYMVVRESNGRMEQITHAGTTYVKHAFGAANTSSTCGTCTTGGSGLRVGCADTYGASTNANRFYLGPASEIDPWTGIWNPIGSYFDRGDPDVGSPANGDGVRSLTSGTTGVFTDLVKNRVTLREPDLLTPGRLFHCMHIVVEGESGDRHLDNVGHRQMTATWNGTTWAFANPAAGVGFTAGTVLNEWAGATVNQARNGNDDGHFIVAAKVTQLPNGLFHYEYAIQNFDNVRGGAAVRVPVCPSIPVSGVGFRDPNDDLLDDWTWVRTPTELVWNASATNPLDWNNIYNVWFDCPQPPVAASIAIDQARPGLGALTVSVASQVPGGVATVVNMGPGCGQPAPTLTASSLPTIPNPGFAMTLQSDPQALMWLFFSYGSANLSLAPGCTQYIDDQQSVMAAVLVADQTGLASFPLPIPDNLALEGLSLYWQAAEFVVPGPVLGFYTISNGSETRGGCR